VIKELSKIKFNIFQPEPIKIPNASEFGPEMNRIIPDDKIKTKNIAKEKYLILLRGYRSPNITGVQKPNNNNIELARKLSTLFSS